MLALVTGAQGQLGRELVHVLGRAGHEVAAAGRELDIADPRAVEDAIRTETPEVIFNASAATDVDRCEDEPAWADRVNHVGPGILATHARSRGVRLVHVSTDYVFDGRTHRPYREVDPPAPLSVYGASKLAGERAVLTEAPGSLVVRTSWVFGASPRNFVAAMLARASEGKSGPLRAATDQVGSPTAARDLAEGLVALVERGQSGLYHLTNAGTATRFALARAALDAAGLRAAPLQPARLKDFPSAAMRPRYSALDCGRAIRCGVVLRPWREALAVYVRRGPASEAGEEGI